MYNFGMPINKEVTGIDKIAKRMSETDFSKREFETAWGCDDGENGKACNRGVSQVVLYDIRQDDSENPGGDKDIPIMLCAWHYPSFKQRYEWLDTDPNVQNVRVLTKEEYVKGGQETLVQRTIGWLMRKKR